MDWYYAENSERKGPVSDEALAQLAGSGVVSDTTLVWRAGLAGWQPYASVREAAPTAGAQALVFCSECGRQYTPAELVAIGSRQVCAGCKAMVLQRIREGSGSVSARPYAGFWIRFGAHMIDSVMLGIVNTIISLILIGSALAAEEPAIAVGAILGSYAIGIAIGMSYEGWFLVNKGATVGKMALGLKVIRASGAQITWGLAIGRYFSKLVSGMMLSIGFLMAAWDEERRTLHDRICDTRVVKG
jgi:uncharacterized RDD family membrane protein YckC